MEADAPLAILGGPFFFFEADASRYPPPHEGSSLLVVPRIEGPGGNGGGRCSASAALIAAVHATPASAALLKVCICPLPPLKLAALRFAQAPFACAAIVTFQTVLIVQGLPGNALPSVADSCPHLDFYAIFSVGRTPSGVPLGMATEVAVSIFLIVLIGVVIFTMVGLARGLLCLGGGRGARCPLPHALTRPKRSLSAAPHA